MSTSRRRDELMSALEAALRDVSGAGVLFSQAVAHKLGINSTDLESLGCLMDGPKTAGEIAKATRLTTGAVTGVIDRLERARFVKRERTESDRRKVLVRVTSETMTRIVPLYEPMRRATAELLSRYDDAELSLLLDFLVRAHEASANAIETFPGGPVPEN